MATSDAPITVGTVSLTVANLDASVRYYQQQLGLKLHRQQVGVAWLGAGAADLLRLEERRGARRVRGATGLYHFALLLPSRLELGLALRHFAQSGALLSGMSDHAVSEALYLSDPDGHGIEVYRDRPRDEWEFPGGALKMTVDPLDAGALLALAGQHQGEWAGMPSETVMGHIHLHVARIPETERFYVDLLGLDLMARYGSAASFLSSGGYHHHLGTNTWNGVGAPPPPPDALGLQWFQLKVEAPLLPPLLARLESAEVPVVPFDDGWQLADPAGNGIRLVACE